MTHRIVVSKYKRNGRAEVLVLKEDKTERELMFLHPDHNAVDAAAWAELAKREDVAKMLAAGVLVDKGDAPAAEAEAPAEPAPEAPAPAPAPALAAPPPAAAPVVVELEGSPADASEK